MTQSTVTEPAIQQETTVANLPVSFLKEVLKTADDEQLARFLHGYAIGSAAEQFIAIMIESGQRTEFFVALAKSYPEDWKTAVEYLSETK